MADHLSLTQTRILFFLAAWDHAYRPSVRDIAAGIRRSVAPTYRHLPSLRPNRLTERLGACEMHHLITENGQGTLPSG